MTEVVGVAAHLAKEVVVRAAVMWAAVQPVQQGPSKASMELRREARVLAVEEAGVEVRARVAVARARAEEATVRAEEARARAEGATALVAEAMAWARAVAARVAGWRAKAVAQVEAVAWEEVAAAAAVAAAAVEVGAREALTAQAEMAREAAAEVARAREGAAEVARAREVAAAEVGMAREVAVEASRSAAILQSHRRRCRLGSCSGPNSHRTSCAESSKGGLMGIPAGGPGRIESCHRPRPRCKPCVVCSAYLSDRPDTGRSG